MNFEAGIRFSIVPGSSRMKKWICFIFKNYFEKRNLLHRSNFESTIWFSIISSSSCMKRRNYFICKMMLQITRVNPPTFTYQFNHIIMKIEKSIPWIPFLVFQLWLLCFLIHLVFYMWIRIEIIDFFSLLISNFVDV